MHRLIKLCVIYLFYISLEHPAQFFNGGEVE